jgi:NAD-dependent SIR2 family protein deacetylase
MEVKKCGRCHQTKPMSEFGRTKADRYFSHCKECREIYRQYRTGKKSMPVNYMKVLYGKDGAF